MMDVDDRTKDELSDLASRRFVIVDLEATCWKDDRTKRNEIIEIGALSYDAMSGVGTEFQTFVRPIVHQELSPFCIALTKIDQAMVDDASAFPVALEKMLMWSAPVEPFVLASWGAYDKNQFNRDCELHQLTYPFGRHVNIKKMFGRLYKQKPCGMAKALAFLRLELEGTHHRGIDDARNITRIFDVMMKTAIEGQKR